MQETGSEWHQLLLVVTLCPAHGAAGGWLWSVALRLALRLPCQLNHVPSSRECKTYHISCTQWVTLCLHPQASPVNLSTPPQEGEAYFPGVNTEAQRGETTCRLQSEKIVQGQNWN